MRHKAYKITHSIAGVLLASAFVVVAFGTGTLVVLQAHMTPASNAASVLISATHLDPGPLLAKAAIVYDPSNGEVLYQKDADESLPLASLTKLMTADIILSTESPSTPITISASDIAISSDAADAEFHANDTLPLSDLIQFGLIASSNVAMQAAAESLGGGYLDRMNDVAQSLGFSKTHFNDPTGLDMNETTSGAYSSAYDVGRLAALFYRQYPQYFEDTQQPNVSVRVDGRELSAAATGAPLLSLSGFVGAKTGYTTLAGGNIVAVFDIEIDHPLIAVVLGSSEEGRFSDIKALITAAETTI